MTEDMTAVEAQDLKLKEIKSLIDAEQQIADDQLAALESAKKTNSREEDRNRELAQKFAALSAQL